MNVATIIILAILAVLVGFIIWRMVKNKSVGCDCSSCASSGHCPGCAPSPDKK